MGIVTTVVRNTFVYSLSLFYGFIVCCRFAFNLVMNPRRPFWFCKTRETPPDCLSDPAYGKHSYLQLDDIKIHYVENGDTTKPLMLFLHGFPEFWYSWRYQIKEFSKDYWTVAIDMRGYGDSGKPAGISNYAIKLLVNDIKGIAEALGRDKFTLVCHDWGSAVGWGFIRKYPEMLNNYIIMSVPEGHIFYKKIRYNFRQFMMSWYIFLFQLPYLPELMAWSYDMRIFGQAFRQGANSKSVTDEDIEAYKYTFGKPGAFTAPINYYRANFGRAPGNKKPLDDIVVPGLFLIGEKEAYIDVKVVDVMRKVYNNLDVEVVKGANHFLQQDAHEKVNELMRAFLKAHDT